MGKAEIDTLAYKIVRAMCLDAYDLEIEEEILQAQTEEEAEGWEEDDEIYVKIFIYIEKRVLKMLKVAIKPLSKLLKPLLIPMSNWNDRQIERTLNEKFGE